MTSESCCQQITSSCALMTDYVEKLYANSKICQITGQMVYL